MIRGFTGADGSVLFGLLAESAGDILLRTDRNGFITETAPGLECLGIDPSETLFAPHVADLAGKGHSHRVRQYWSEAIAGLAPAERVEFPLGQPRGLGFTEQWYALAIRPTLDAAGMTNGSIGILRTIERRHMLDEELLAAAMTDPLTGLGNRHAFQTYLSRQPITPASGAVILFGIDRFRAIILRYGQSKGDEVLWAFAQFLRAMLGEEPLLMRMEGERFAAILPGEACVAAQGLADEAIGTFSILARESGCDGLLVSASAGIAAIAGHHDEVLANAELALTLAQASGGQRAELREAGPCAWQDRKRA